MKIEIKQSVLSKILSIVQKGTSTSSNLLILEGILIEAYNNRLKLTSTNLELGIEMSTECNVLMEGSIVVSSKLFGNIIRTLPDENIAIETANDNMNIKCDNANFNIIGQPAADYPKMHEIDNAINVCIPKQLLKSMIKQTVIATAQVDIMPILKGVLLKISYDSISMAALDKYRLAIKNIRMSNLQQVSAVIPAKTLNELGRIIDEDEGNVTINLTQNHILFNLGNIIVYSRLLEGSFINYEHFLIKEHTTKAIVNKRNFQQSIERAAVLGDEQGLSLVKIEIYDEKMIIKAGSKAGNVDENLDISIEGSNLSISFNTKYLLEGLKVIGSEEIEIYFTSEISPCIIKPKDDDSYIYLVLPVRMLT